MRNEVDSKLKLIRHFIVLMVLALFLADCGGGGGGDSITDQPPADGTPSVPTGLNAAVMSSTRIDLSWNVSVDNSSVIAYNVYGGEINVFDVTFGTSYSETGLQPNTLYCYSVSALDDSGNESDQCSAVCVSTDPAQGAQWQTVMSGTDMNLTALATNGNRIVVVGDDREVLTSEDGSDWAFHNPGLVSPVGMNDVLWNGSKFVGVEGWTYTSLDGIGWNVNTTTSDELVAVAWSDVLNLHIAVGEDGLIMSSPDGSAWNVESSPSVSWLNDVIWGNGRFIVVGENGTILSSSNGSVWSTVPSGTTRTLTGVTWSGSAFVVVGGSDVLTSPDGDTWSPGTPPSAYLESVAWSNSLGMYAAVGWNGAIYTSATGNDWADRSPSIYSPSYAEVIWEGTQFIAVGERGDVVTSSDGVTWTTQTSGSDIQSVIWDGSQFVAVGDQGKLITSIDGDTWTYDSSGDGADFLLDIAWSGSLYAVGAQSFIYNFDPSGWSAGQWLGATTSCSGMMWDGSQFVGVGSGVGGAATWTSPDGSTFTYHDPGTGSTSVLRGVTWNGTDQYMAVGYGGLIVSSTNGSIWSTEISNTSTNLYGVNYGGGQYVAVGASGSIITSPNGTLWSAQDATISSSLYNVAYTGAEYVAVGASGRIVTSADGASWSADQHTFTAYNGVAWNGTTLVIVGDDGTVVRRQ
jgi:hypothetical protein